MHVLRCLVHAVPVRLWCMCSCGRCPSQIVVHVLMRALSQSDCGACAHAGAVPVRLWCMCSCGRCPSQIVVHVLMRAPVQAWRGL